MKRTDSARRFRRLIFLSVILLSTIHLLLGAREASAGVVVPVTIAVIHFSWNVIQREK